MLAPFDQWAALALAEIVLTLLLVFNAQCVYLVDLQ